MIIKAHLLRRAETSNLDSVTLFVKKPQLTILHVTSVLTKGHDASRTGTVAHTDSKRRILTLLYPPIIAKIAPAMLDPLPPISQIAHYCKLDQYLNTSNVQFTITLAICGLKCLYMRKNVNINTRLRYADLSVYKSKSYSA